MSGIRDFFQSLSESQGDVLVQMMNDLQDSTSALRMDNLQKFLTTLNHEIDEINRKRDALGHKAENIEAFLSLLEERIKNHKDIELDLLHSLLLHWRMSLKLEIEELRPQTKLEKKYDTERKYDTLTELKEAAVHLVREMGVLNKAQSNCAPAHPPIPVKVK